MSIGITVVIPAHNRGPTLPRAIRSAMDQELSPAEILVIDDGSTDYTALVVRTFSDRVKYFYRKHEGVSAARNAGVEKSASDWTAFLDSDDYWLPDHLSKIALAIASTNGDAACYFSDARYSDDGTETHWNRCRFDISGAFQLQSDAREWALMHTQPMLLPASVIRKKAYWSVGGLDPNVTTREDTMLFHLLAMQYPLCAVRNVGLVVTNDGEQRLTLAYDSRHPVYWTSSILMYRKILSRVGVNSSYHRRIIHNRLSDSYSGLAKAHLRAGDFGKAMRSAIAASLASPSHFLMTASARIARPWRERHTTSTEP